MNTDLAGEQALLLLSAWQRLAAAGYNYAALDATDDTATPCHIASTPQMWYGEDTAMVPQETDR